MAQSASYKRTASMALLALFVVGMGYLAYSGVITMVSACALPARGGPLCSCFQRSRARRKACSSPACGGRAAGTRAHGILAGSRSAWEQDGLKAMASESEDYLKNAGPTGKLRGALHLSPLRMLC
jgi:hypothetical protein